MLFVLYKNKHTTGEKRRSRGNQNKRLNFVDVILKIKTVARMARPQRAKLQLLPTDTLTVSQCGQLHQPDRIHSLRGHKQSNVLLEEI